jgi:hypothetical protein
MPAINPVSAAIINLLPAKLPESHFQRKENFARLSCHFSIQSANKHDHTPIDKNQPFSAVKHDGASIRVATSAERGEPAAFTGQRQSCAVGALSTLT